MGGSATSPLRSRGSPDKGTEAKLAHKGVRLPRHACVLGGPYTRDKSKRGAQKGGIATSPLRSRGSPNKEKEAKVAHKGAVVLCHPCVLGSPQTRGQRQRWPRSGHKCYITTAFSGVPKQGDKGKGGREVGTSATSALCSRGSRNKGTKAKVAHKWGEVLHHPCVLGVPGQGDKGKASPQGGSTAMSRLRSRGPLYKGQKQTWPTKGRNSYITTAISGVPKQGERGKSGPQGGGSAMPSLRSRESPNKGTKARVAQKWAQVLHHHCILRGPETRGQSQRWPTRGRKCYITPAVLGVPKQRDKVKSGPPKGRKCYITPAFLGVPNYGTKLKVAPKWAEMGRHPCVLGGPQTRGQSQRWPTSGTSATSPLCSRGSPNKGSKGKLAHKGVQVLRHPGVLRSPHKTGTTSKVAHKWAEVLHHPCSLGGPQTRGQSQR